MVTPRGLLAALVTAVVFVAIGVGIARLSPWLLLGWPIAWAALIVLWLIERGERDQWDAEPAEPDTDTERTPR